MWVFLRVFVAASLVLFAQKGSAEGFGVPDLEDLAVGYVAQGKPFLGYYVVAKKAGSGWVLDGVYRAPKFGPGLEVVYVKRDMSYAQPYFEHVEIFNGSTFECSPLVDKKGYYTPCKSRLTFRLVGKSIGKNIVAAISTLGLASGSHRAVDREAVLGFIASTGALQEIALNNYRSEFDSSGAVADLNVFIEKYSAYDPESLVPKAILRLKSARIKEEEDRQRRILAEAKAEDERQRIERRKQHIAQEMARIALEEREKSLRAANAFRRTIAVGVETNCGPVLELRGELVKVYFPVMDYGNEHWIRRSELFDSTHGCRFVNGRYVP